jgi:predicted dehydrogenase
MQNTTPNRPIRMGMIGGGPDAFIGAVHRMAAALDGKITLHCGAFSSDPQKSRHFATHHLGLPPDRAYSSWQEMIEKQANLPPQERIDFITIVTPNHLHAGPAIAALRAGFPVACDKPLAHTLQDAQNIYDTVCQTGLPFLLTHNYTGYPLVKQARHIVRSGELGPIRKILVEYPQGWLATPLEHTGQKQASWRTDPARAGAVGCMGDIGTHAENLAEYITGLRIHSLCADLTTFVPGRRLDDDGNVLLRYHGGAKGILHASQISIDEENGLAIRIYGEKGGLHWRQEEPNTLIRTTLGGHRQIIRAGINYADRLCPAAIHASRLPCGHPEGFIEAFANLYKNFAAVLQARHHGQQPDPLELDFPTAHDGLRGMQFLDALLRSTRQGGSWVTLP